MNCVKCGQSNPGGLNFCQRCNAQLLKIAGAAASSSLDIEEGKAYLTPDRAYPTEFLYNLSCRAYEYVHQGAPGEPLLEAYHIVRSRIDEFEAEGLPALLSELESERHEMPDDDHARQMIYLLSKGVSMYREGFVGFDDFVVSGETEALIFAITRMQEGNDHLGLAGELAQTRSQKIEDALLRAGPLPRVSRESGVEADAMGLDTDSVTSL